MKFVCANADLVQNINLDTDYGYITASSKSLIMAVETLANSFTKSKSDCVLFVWNTSDPADLIRATEEACVEDVNFKKIIDDLEKNLDYGILGDFDLESIELENGMTISVVKYVTMNNFVESKKSVKKSLKESKKWVSDVADDLFISFEDILNIFEEYGYGKKEAQDFYDSKWDDVGDVFNEMTELAVLFELENWEESKESARKSIKESNRTKLDIIKDMVDLAYDVRRQSKMDKDSYFGNQPNSVINAKNDKVYEKFVDLAEKLKLHGWNQFIDYAYDLIDEYENVIEESKNPQEKSIKESKDSYKVKVLNEILDAMTKDEYNIPKVGIYGVTKNINLDKGAIEALIKYYK